MNCHDIFSYTWHLNLCYLIFDASALHRICVFFLCWLWFYYWVIMVVLSGFLGGVSREDGVFFAHVQKNGVYFFASFFVIYSRQKHSTCHLYFTIQIFIMFTGNFWVFFIFYVFLSLCWVFWFFCVFNHFLIFFVFFW